MGSARGEPWDLAFDALKNLGDQAQNHSQQELALAKYRELLDMARTRAVQVPESVSRASVAVALQRVALIQTQRRELDEAQRAVAEGLSIVRELLTGEPGRAEWQHARWALLHTLGFVEEARQHRDRALAGHREALDMIRQLADLALDRDDWRRDLAHSLGILGQGERERGNIDAALELHREELSICLTLVERDPDDLDHAAALCRAFTRLGEVHVALYDDPAAYRYFLEAVRPAALLYRNGRSDGPSAAYLRAQLYYYSPLTRTWWSETAFFCAATFGPFIGWYLWRPGGVLIVLRWLIFLAGFYFAPSVLRHGEAIHRRIVRIHRRVLRARPRRKE